MRTYLRCTKCDRLLTREQFAKSHSCKCGGGKFRGVIPERGDYLSLVERVTEKASGDWSYYVVDSSLPGPSPDALNKDNEAYWQRVFKEVAEEQGETMAKGIVEARRRRSHG